MGDATHGPLNGQDQLLANAGLSLANSVSLEHWRFSCHSWPKQTSAWAANTHNTHTHTHSTRAARFLPLDSFSALQISVAPFLSCDSWEFFAGKRRPKAFPRAADPHQSHAGCLPLRCLPAAGRCRLVRPAVIFVDDGGMGTSW